MHFIVLYRKTGDVCVHGMNEYKAVYSFLSGGSASNHSEHLDDQQKSNHSFEQSMYKKQTLCVQYLCINSCSLNEGISNRCIMSEK